ncbi:MAG: class I SAM-dependent methyltransferase [Oscillospiraceae bacterium]
MEKKDVIEFFDRCAPQWDAEAIHDDEKINFILDCGGITHGANVLDVACGTGVLFPDYLARGVGQLTGVDISPEMVKRANQKVHEFGAKVLCGDIMEMSFDEPFDCVMLYNAFPHFPDPEGLLLRLSACLKPGGRLTIAHGMSRAQLDAHHSVTAEKVSLKLMHEDQLATLFSPYLDVNIKISNSEMYIVSGIKR